MPAGSIGGMAPVRVAMWSGPRNISTALMRSFGSRADCAVTDEPLYAHYLAQLPHSKRAAHPGWEQVIASQPTDAAAVAAALNGPVPGGRSVWYQKHMAHHLTPGMDRAWIASLSNAFLIRRPAAMICSFIKVIPNPTPHDLGLPQQAELFDALSAAGRMPPVIVSATILKDPRAALGALCEALSIPFNENMLRWAPGPRDTDGVWAPHWYAAVNASTGFAPFEPRDDRVPARLEPVLAECEALYARLARRSITV